MLTFSSLLHVSDVLFAFCICECMYVLLCVCVCIFTLGSLNETDYSFSFFFHCQNVLLFYKVYVRGTLVKHIILINTTFSLHHHNDISPYHLWVKYCKYLGSVLREHCLVNGDLTLWHFFIIKLSPSFSCPTNEHQ